MSASERRFEDRINLSVRFSPIACVLVSGSHQINLTIVNYHYRGACFKVGVGDFRMQDPEAYLLFRIGYDEIARKIKFRVVWETVATDGSFGVEFAQESSFVLERAERFLTNSINAPVISVRDPLDPNRTLYLKVLNISTTGMLLNTSLANKHLFPGMELRNASLEIPGMGKTEIDLYIENSRPAENQDSVFYGASLKNSHEGYQALIRKYLTSLGGAGDNSNRLKQLTDSGLIQKDLKSHLTIREVTSQEHYEAVLRLRYLGYKNAGKTAPNMTWEDMGEGLLNEGVIIGAFLAGQLIASVELRFSGQHILRISEKTDIDGIESLAGKKFVEINKLVVHPDAQRSDVVVGLFQKLHALALLNGKLNVLFIAEDKLVKLYSRLGAKMAGFSYTHPVKTDTRLHVMTISRETYEDANDINPLAWSTVYQTTHEFFSSVGVSSSMEFSWMQKILLYTSQASLSLTKRFKAKKKPNVSSEVTRSLNKERLSSDVIDPKWTKQHLHASVLLPYLLEAADMIGRERTIMILNRYGFQWGYFSSASNWISIDFFDEFIAQFSLFGDQNELQKRAGYRNLSKEVMGVNHFLLKHFLTPTASFKTFGSYLPKFNKTRTYQLLGSGSNYVHFRLGLVDRSLKPKDPSAKENWLAVFDAQVKVTNGSRPQIQQVRSIFDGDTYCEYIIRWKNPLFTWRKGLAILAAMFAVFGLYQLVADLVPPQHAQATGIGVISLIAISALIYLLRSATRKYHSMVDSLVTFEQDADERYRELQSSKQILEKSYQEGKILESLSREMQTSEDLTGILNTTLSAVCGKFEFKRGFLMLLDAEGHYLRTVAIHGADASTEDLWQFKVDVKLKRDNPVVLSSAFHSGQSILISDIDSHKFHLNEASRRLIERLGSQGFAIVPIPSFNASWGVLVADKGASSEPISRRDLVALQRVCQAMGLALDKKAKIESEIKIRRAFQKYVPSMVVESMTGSREPVLGGETREIICLFLDIRNFTEMSTLFPAQILVETLNHVFDLLQTVVKESGGIIDKFLGDGAMVTWGAVPGSNLDPQLVLNSALKFLNLLEEWNERKSSEGFRRIDVGLGIHKGNVIAGNIGSHERMEFTVIGPTVNLASRLEQLNKLYQSNIVISESLLGFESLVGNWEIVDKVQVRGLDNTVRVAIYRSGKIQERKLKVAA